MCCAVSFSGIESDMRTETREVYKINPENFHMPPMSRFDVSPVFNECKISNDLGGEGNTGLLVSELFCKYTWESWNMEVAYILFLGSQRGV